MPTLMLYATQVAPFLTAGFTATLLDGSSYTDPEAPPTFAGQQAVILERPATVSLPDGIATQAGLNDIKSLINTFLDRLTPVSVVIIVEDTYPAAPVTESQEHDSMGRHATVLISNEGTYSTDDKIVFHWQTQIENQWYDFQPKTELTTEHVYAEAPLFVDLGAPPAPWRVVTSYAGSPTVDLLQMILIEAPG